MVCYFVEMIGNILLVLSTVVGLLASYWYFRKNLTQIRQRNQSEPSVAKRFFNYPLTVLWYCYLFVFFIGLTVNNLILP